ncbi:MAG TPA: NUDIX domain-containing protein [Chitinophagaceae bacterium]|jgi:ADP-ribose pyrophosphatase YjhB (NUDIX family)|nr:NUDIX domain-containing protein [Chitinophagaceae bacterium]
MMNRITVRVYGLLLNEQNELLVSDELIRGSYFTKFPGGGLEWGEGTRDCLRREFMEEMGLKVEVGAHVYTTDYFQESAFRAGDQILSIYYAAKPLEAISVRLSNRPFDFEESKLAAYKTSGEIETFRFIPWEALTVESVDLPIDRTVVKMILDNPAILR